MWLSVLTAPRRVMSRICCWPRRDATQKPLLCYPNSGEAWDPLNNCWIGSTGVTDFHTPAQRWHAAGASLIGGCCRTTPDTRFVQHARGAEPAGVDSTSPDRWRPRLLFV